MSTTKSLKADTNFHPIIIKSESNSHLIENQSVCLPSEEYKRMRARDLSYDPIKEECKLNTKPDNVLYNYVIGGFAGFMVGYFGSKIF